MRNKPCRDRPIDSQQGTSITYPEMYSSQHAFCAELLSSTSWVDPRQQNMTCALINSCRSFENDVLKPVRQLRGVGLDLICASSAVRLTLPFKGEKHTIFAARAVLKVLDIGSFAQFQSSITIALCRIAQLEDRFHRMLRVHWHGEDCMLVGVAGDGRSIRPFIMAGTRKGAFLS